MSRYEDYVDLPATIMIRTCRVCGDEFDGSGKFCPGCKSDYARDEVCGECAPDDDEGEE